VNHRGDFYVGEFKKGRRHGKGKLLKANGYCYDGEFAEGHENGYGLMMSRNKIFEGYFEAGKFHGQGVYKSYSNSKRREIETYIGHFSNGRRDR
jgi:hypothetical protein